MKLLITLLGLLLFGCANVKTIPLKNSYTNGNFEQVTNKEREQVWENIIEFFAKNGLPIKLIDKSSGLIVSNETELSWTWENGKGQLIKPEAWVVIAKQINPNNKMTLKPTIITGEWNIRIKQQTENQTLINVNLVNTKYVTSFSPTPTQFTRGMFQSTGNFEKWIYEAIK